MWKLVRVEFPDVLCESGAILCFDPDNEVVLKGNILRIDSQLVYPATRTPVLAPGLRRPLRYNKFSRVPSTNS